MVCIAHGRPAHSTLLGSIQAHRLAALRVFIRFHPSMSPTTYGSVNWGKVLRTKIAQASKKPGELWSVAVRR